MTFKTKPAPHISYPESTRFIMGNVVVLLLIQYAMAFYYYGVRSLLLGLFTMMASIITDILCSFLYGKKIKWYDFSALITGLIIPLMLPASIPFHIPVIGAVFAIAVAKHPFGGAGYNIFNPAAAGYAFIVTCFSPSVIFRYPVPLERLPIFMNDTVNLVASPAYSLSIGGVPGNDFISMALGNSPGPMGATNILVLLACLLFLIFRNTVRWEIPVSFLATTSLIALLFHRVPGTALDSLFYESMSGMLLFGAVFMLGDPVTTPIRRFGKICYGVLCGVLVMGYRHVGGLEEGFAFALLLMNATVWGFDMISEKLIQRKRRARFENIGDTETQKKTQTTS